MTSNTNKSTSDDRRYVDASTPYGMSLMEIHYQQYIQQEGTTFQEEHDHEAAPRPLFPSIWSSGAAKQSELSKQAIIKILDAALEISASTSTATMVGSSSFFPRRRRPTSTPRSTTSTSTSSRKNHTLDDEPDRPLQDDQ